MSQKSNDIFDLEWESISEEDEATMFSLSLEYLEAAEVLIKNPPTKVNYWIVIYYLLGHSAELALKSFMFKKDVSLEDLKKIGHNLNKLITKSHELGLPEFICLRKLSPIYSKKSLEYRRRKKESFPSAEALFSEVQQLHSLVFSHVSQF